MTAAPPEKSMRSRRNNASFWTILSFGSNTALRLISNLILTRLLTPEIFGLMALAKIFMRGIRMFSDVGTQASIVRSDRGDDEDFLRTAWTVQVVRGAIIAVVACLIAWPVSKIYGQEVLFPLICVLSITPLFSGFSTVSASTVNRKMLLRVKTILAFCTQIFTVIVTASAAWWLGTVWALAIGAVLGSCLSLILGHIFLPRFKHTFRWEKEAVSELIRFGRWILLGTLFTFMGNKGRVAIQGLLVPVEVLGLITLSAMIAWLPGRLFSRILGDVIFPSFSEIRRKRPQDLNKALAKVRVTMTLGVFPIFFFVSYFAQPIIDLMYDDRYASAGTLLSLMALNSALGMLGMPYQNILLAEGKSGQHATFTFIYSACSILGTVLGFFTFGVLGMFVGVAIGTVIYFLCLVVVGYRSGYRTWALDVLALAAIGVIYVYTLMTLTLPPDLAGI
jgi:O-antigen/teichoic acid export membrane protein